MIATLGSPLPYGRTDEHKKTCVDVSSQLLQRHAAEGDDFLFNIVTGDES